jgi:hypothetical protein
MAPRAGACPDGNLMLIFGCEIQRQKILVKDKKISKHPIEFKLTPSPGIRPNFGVLQEPIRVVIVVQKVTTFWGEMSEDICCGMKATFSLRFHKKYARIYFHHSRAVIQELPGVTTY